MFKAGDKVIVRMPERGKKFSDLAWINAFETLYGKPAAYGTVGRDQRRDGDTVYISFDTPVCGSRGWYWDASYVDYAVPFVPGDRVIVHVPDPEDYSSFTAGWVNGFENAEGMCATVTTSGETTASLKFDEPICNDKFWSWDIRYMEHVTDTFDGEMSEEDYMSILRGAVC